MRNKSNRRCRRGHSLSLEREISASEAETSQDNETVIETFSNVDNLSSVRDKEAVLFDATQSEPYEMQLWTQIIADNANRKWLN